MGSPSRHRAGPGRDRYYVLGIPALLKRRTPQNIVWGGAIGCMPVLIGWAAVRGRLDWAPVVFFPVGFCHHRGHQPAPGQSCGWPAGSTPVATAAALARCWLMTAVVT